MKASNFYFYTHFILFYVNGKNSDDDDNDDYKYSVND